MCGEANQIYTSDWRDLSCRITVGAYDTCGHLCKYCYANYNRENVKRNIRRHEPSSPFLVCNGARIPIVDKELISVGELGLVKYIKPLSITEYCMLLQTTWATNSKRSIGSIISEMKLNDEFMYIKPELIYDEFDGKCPSWEELKAL